MSVVEEPAGPATGPGPGEGPRWRWWMAPAALLLAFGGTLVASALVGAVVELEDAVLEVVRRAGLFPKPAALAMDGRAGGGGGQG